MSFNNKDKFSFNSLTTTSTFDRGSKKYAITNSTQAVGENEYKFSSNISTPISVLVQSLIQHLCKKLEKDVNRANNLYKSICEKLYQLKIIDDSYTMGEFEVMRHQYQQALCQLVEVANDRDISILYNWPLIQESLLEWSRYHQDFEELFHIARGGFGNVFRAKHRLDKVEYAIKKICIKSSDIKSVFNHLSEVKTFASLNHPNIVSYKAAWLEPLIESPNLKNIEDKCENRINYSSNESSEIDSSYLSYNSKSNNSDSICFEDKNTSLKKPVSNIIDCKAVCKVKNSLENSQIITAHANLKWAVLFIQMELCQKTLKCWLEERNSLMSEFKISNMPENFSNEFFNLDILNSDSFEERIDQIKHSHVPTAFEIITQLTQAIEYIHQKGIIHHDVKPSNIFINMETKKINVQLADFGLACPLQRCHKGSAIGTQLYAAPEQLNGECDSKSDIFSLGIVFLELLAIFNTDMEKVKVFQQSKNGDIPEQITTDFPVLTHYIKNLIQSDPIKRMNATDLLESLRKLKDNKESTITLLEQKLLAKDLELAAKDKEIIRLRNKLASVKLN